MTFCFLEQQTAGLPGSTAQDSGLSGFRCASWGTRYTACKAFGNGKRNLPSDASGFLIEQPYQYFAACDAQENPGPGFLLRNTSDCALTACAAVSNGGSGFVFQQVHHVIADACSIAHIPGLLFRQPHGIEIDVGSFENRVVGTVTGTNLAPVKTTPTLGANEVVVNCVHYGRLYDAWGTSGEGQEHFVFSKSGTINSQNPYYAIKTGTGTIPEASIQGWDGQTARTFTRFFFNHATAVWGDPSVRPAVSTSQPASSLGSVVRRLPIYNETGTLLGYIPIYSAIT